MMAKNQNMKTPLIDCQSVFKIFGDNPHKVLEKSQQQVDYDLLQKNNCVVGVDNITLSVDEGETLVLMGLSGSGKSTLLRCMTRLHDITLGKILVGGEDISLMSEKELMNLRRHKMGMVFQSFSLLPHKTVLENIVFPLQIKGIKTQERVKRARDMIELVSLHGKENSFPRELSGGQQQRVGIARSLAVEPDIWFLDEPFSALDPLIRREMQEEFLRLQSMLNKTIVFITHDFDEALRLADRIAVMRNGKIEQIDTPANIVLNPATDYVKKFTNEVPREKVLKVSSLMDQAIKNEALSNLTVAENSLIESVAEKVLLENKPVAVLNKRKDVVGILRQEKILNVVFGNGNPK